MLVGHVQYTFTFRELQSNILTFSKLHRKKNLLIKFSVSAEAK